MGRVFEVEDPARPGLRLALKQTLSERVGPTGLERFRREGELLARIRHPGVVAVHALGEAPDGPWLLMDLVEGESLGELVRREGPLPAGEAVRIVADLAEAVAALHAQGVLHRDLKPENALRRPDGRVVLIDFGLAWARDVDRLTRSQVVLGSPAYMPPEQAEGRSQELLLDERADVYGLGATLFALLTGRPPFSGRTPVEVLNQVLHAAPRWPRPAPPRSLRRLVERSLAKEPERRPESAASLAAELRAWAPGPERPAGALALVLLLLGAAALAAARRPAPGEPAAGVGGAASGPSAPSAEGVPTSLLELAGAGFVGSDRVLGWTASGEARLLRLDAAGEARLLERWPLDAPVVAAAHDPAGRRALLALAAPPGSPRLWCLRPGAAPSQVDVPLTPEELAPVGTPWEVTAVALGPGRLGVGTVDGRLPPQFWAFREDGTRPLLGATLKSHDGPVVALALEPDGAVITASPAARGEGRGRPRVGRWVPAPGSSGQELVGIREATPSVELPEAPVSLARAPDGAWWAGCVSGAARRIDFDLESPRAGAPPWRSGDGPRGPLAALCFSRDGARAWTLSVRGPDLRGEDEVRAWRVEAQGWGLLGRVAHPVALEPLRGLALEPGGERLLLVGARGAALLPARAE